MAKKSGVTYYKQAQVRSLSDGSMYTLGMTVEKLDVEVCGNTHPYYTGKNTTIDTAGRIDKFKARAAKAGNTQAPKAKKRTNRKIKLSIADLNSPEESSANDAEITAQTDTPIATPETQEEVAAAE